MNIITQTQDHDNGNLDVLDWNFLKWDNPRNNFNSKEKKQTETAVQGHWRILKKNCKVISVKSHTRKGRSCNIFKKKTIGIISQNNILIEQIKNNRSVAISLHIDEIQSFFKEK